ncbi:MAG: ABC transporter ATP-binding protein, partial [Cyclobacteriaceae bacterium]
MMASRWGFEAAMVTLFKENKFEKQFYDLDKQIGEAEYKKRYYIPTIEGKVNLVTDSGIDDKVRAEALALLRNEIESELRIIGMDKFPEFNQLSGQLSPEIKEKTERFLATLKSMYSNRYNSAMKEKEKLVSEMLSTDEGKVRYFELQEKYANEAIEDIVTGKLGTDRIQEVNNRLVQKNNLIYKSPNPTHALDFQEQFFTPTKHFLGFTFDTFYFNIAFIWFYCVLFMITLYFDVLKKSLRILGKINPFGAKR